MATVFTMIINGDIPGRFVWRDERAVAFLTINPVSTGHTLVVPIDEVDHWADLDPDLAAHLFAVAHVVAKAQMEAFAPERIALLIAGFEVPHTHLHVMPANGIRDTSLEYAGATPDAAELDAAAEAIRAALRAMGRAEVPAS
ncbi:MAG: HIT family protein [Acidimicrobiia bacterium]